MVIYCILDHSIAIGICKYGRYQTELISGGLSIRWSIVILFALTALMLCASALGSVVINEIEVNPPEGGTDWVELYNSGDAAVDLSGWKATITDGGWVGEAKIPEGTIIQAKGFYLAVGSPLWHHEDGGYASLYNAAGEKVDESAFCKDGLDNDFTWGRRPDGHDTNTDGDWGYAMATKGKPNVL
jgi:hypothetical protein